MAEAIDTDTVVVGLGAMGAQTLWRLAQRGRDVVGIEMFEPGHDHGSSHGESRLIRTAYLEGAAYVPLAQAAWQGWNELGKASKEQVALRCGTLMVGRADSQAITGARASAQRHDLACRQLSAAQVATQYPGHAVATDHTGLFEWDGGAVFPEAAIRAAVRLSREHGARVWTAARVQHIDPDPQHPQVSLDDGTTVLRARRIVVTAGAWLGQLLPDLAWAVGGLQIQRRVLGWFPVTQPQWHDLDHTPVFVRDEGDGTTWYGFPSLDGGHTVKIGIHADGVTGPGAQWGEPVEPDLGPRAPDKADADRLASLVEQLRGIGPRPVRMASCMYTMTPDQHFLVGQPLQLPGLVVGGGFSGHGYKFATVIGAALADLAEHGTTTLPVQQFDPGRFG